MAASTAQPASKSSKKKAAKAIERIDSPAPSTNGGTDDKTTGDDTYESPYIKELQKTIRSVNKKITNASKTDSLLKANAGKSLDELVDSKVINADQKAQIEKMPALKAQLAQLEEALTQYQKVDEQYRTQAAADKAEWEKAQAKIKAGAIAEANEGFSKSLREKLLVLSQFLRLAAHRREEATEPESNESQAIEGVLLTIYAGDESAVDSMLKLLAGSADHVWSVPGEQLQTTYSHVKALAQEDRSPFDTEAPEAETVKEVASDPTVAHATPTDVEIGNVTVPIQAAQAFTNGIDNVQVSDDVANAVAESHWDTCKDISISGEWVDVKIPRDPAETETGVKATPAAPANTQSWADDHPETVYEPNAAKSADPNDGFHPVQRKQTRNDGGNPRGRGRGGFRGRGQGEGRGGRGRGNRTASGAPRGGPRRTEIETS